MEDRVLSNLRDKFGIDLLTCGPDDVVHLRTCMHAAVTADEQGSGAAKKLRESLAKLIRIDADAELLADDIAKCEQQLNDVVQEQQKAEVHLKHLEEVEKFARFEEKLRYRDDSQYAETAAALHELRELGIEGAYHLSHLKRYRQILESFHLAQSETLRVLWKRVQSAIQVKHDSGELVADIDRQLFSYILQCGSCPALVPPVFDKLCEWTLVDRFDSQPEAATDLYEIVREFSRRLDAVYTAFHRVPAVCSSFVSFALPKFIKLVEDGPLWGILAVQDYVTACKDFKEFVEKNVDLVFDEGQFQQNLNNWISQAAAQWKRVEGWQLLDKARKAACDDSYESISASVNEEGSVTVTACCATFCEALAGESDMIERAFRLYLYLVSTRSHSPVPAVAALHYSDLLLVANSAALAKLADFSSTALALAKQLWAAEISTRRRDIADQFEGVDVGHLMEARLLKQAQLAIKRSAHQIGLLGKAWAGTLPDSLTSKSLETLYDAMFERVISDVTRLDDIGVDELNPLQALVQLLLTFSSHASAKIRSKSEKLLVILSEDFTLKETIENFRQKRLTEFDQAEIRSLVLSLFKSSLERENFLNELS